MGDRRGAMEPIERASRDELAALQLARLRALLAHAYARVPHYRAAFDAQGVHPSDLQHLSDLARFPFTVKDDLRAHYPFGMLAARFLAYGVGMFVIAGNPSKHEFWIRNMVFVQVVDLAVGIFYTLNGTISLSLSGFPMFNATLIAALLWIWRPKQPNASRASA